MTPEEHIAKMTKAITQAIKVMSDRFGSTEEDVSRAIQELKASIPPPPKPTPTPAKPPVAAGDSTPVTT